MANWLEDEEQKHAAKREADDQRLRAKMAAEKDALARLTQFHALCTRVNSVRHNALSIDGLVTNGLSKATRGRPFRSEEPVSWRRGLTITTDSQDSIFVDAVKKTVWCERGSDANHTPHERTEILVRTACNLGELDGWAERDILQCIKWLIVETNEVRPSLPGHEILNGESEIVIRYDKRHNNKDPDRLRVLLDGSALGLGWVSSHELDTHLADTGRTFRMGVGSHDLTVTGLGASASIQIDAPPYGVLCYRASFGFFGSLRLALCSSEGRN
jgi:hypothetical protein